VSIASTYFDAVGGLMRRLFDEQQAPVSKAAGLVADSIEQDRLLHVFGTGGHSAMGAEEVFFRAGRLVPVDAMLDGGILLAHGAIRSTLIERTPGYAAAVLEYHQVGQGDVLLIVNAYGINACTIEAAVEGRDRGCSTIAVTSVGLQRALPADHPARHPGGQDLCDLVDVTVDSMVPMGDALIEVPGVSQRVGASSTFLNALALNLIMVEAIALLAERGIDPPIWQSANSPGGDEANREHVRNYRNRIKKL
jgi:uncharacterized phosphosugar-binding protein